MSTEEKTEPTHPKLVKVRLGVCIFNGTVVSPCLRLLGEIDY